MKKTLFIIILSIFALSSLFIPKAASAVSDQFTGFTISPGIIEEWFNPGDSKTKTIYIENNLGKTTTFEIELEDFEASPDPLIATTLLGEKKGPYSLKDYLKPEVSEITIEDGKMAPLRVGISIPKDITLPGFYGAVLVKPKLEEGNLESTKIYPRLGTLFYVGIEGHTAAQSDLVSFKYLPAGNCKGDCNSDDSADKFEVTFQNNDKIHIALAGDIEIKNIFGKVVDKVGIGPWYVMPDCLKVKEEKWKTKNTSMFGLYTADLKLIDSHSGETKEKKIYLWALPWKILLPLVLFALLFYFLLRFFEKHFRVIRVDRQQKRKIRGK